MSIETKNSLSLNSRYTCSSAWESKYFYLSPEQRKGPVQRKGFSEEQTTKLLSLVLSPPKNIAQLITDPIRPQLGIDDKGEIRYFAGIYPRPWSDRDLKQELMTFTNGIKPLADLIFSYNKTDFGGGYFIE